MSEEMQYFRLADRLKYRRERFGATTLHVDRQQTRFFNTGGAQILEALMESRSLPQLHTMFQAPASMHAAIDTFVQELVAHEVAILSPDPGPSAACMFRFDTTSAAVDDSFAPLGVEIELTLRCGRSCAYCAYEALPTFPRDGELSTQEWRTVLHRLRDSGIFFVRFTGGDPLLREDFIELVECANGLDLIVTVGSDLTHLSDEVVAALSATRNLFALQTTLDGSTAPAADRLRGRGNFERVVRGITRLKAANVPVIVGTVLTKMNVDDIYETGRLVGSLGADGYCVAPLYAAGRANAAKMQTFVPDNQDLAKAAAAFARVVEEGLVKPADPAWSKLSVETNLSTLWQDQPFLVRAPDQLVRIDPRGRIYTSIKLKNLLEEEIYLGNIRERDLLDVWRHGEPTQRIRALAYQDSPFGAVLDTRALSTKLRRQEHAV